MKKEEAIAISNTFSVQWRDFLNAEGQRQVFSEVQLTGLYHSGTSMLNKLLGKIAEPEPGESGEEDGKPYGADVDLTGILEQASFDESQKAAVTTTPQHSGVDLTNLVPKTDSAKGDDNAQED